ncbi:MAG TPA: glycosyltransferase, partial [Thermoanaerobaculaceae bacterium]|nr:glycosyltransferase [Thermoanaerobaculaceae bacterium]
MRIAFDARPLLGQRTGVSVWLEGLLRGLAAATDWRFVLCLPRAAASLGVDDLVERCEVLAPAIGRPGTVWLHTAAASLAAGRADVWVGTLGVLPRRLTIPAVLAVHDLTPRSRPQQHTPANRFCFNAYFEESAACADALVCVSAATLAALAAVLPQAARRAEVIREGVDPFFSPGGDAGEARETALRFAGGRTFIVQLGTLEPRKGIATLLAAHAALLRADRAAPDLVLAGAPGWGGGWLARALAAHPERARVHLPGYVSREDARALLRHAELGVLASEEEGFGLPLAEALACGAACVVSDAAALVEVAGGAARRFRRGEAAAL